MLRLSRFRVILVLLVVLLLAAGGGWLYSRRVPRVEMESYVPESALGYLEINDDGTYLTHIEGEYASRLQFNDFAKKGLWRAAPRM